MNYSIINAIDTALTVGQVSFKVAKEIYKVTKIVALIAFHLLQIVWIVAQDLAAQQVEASLEKEIKLLEPAKEVKLLMPSKEPKIMKAQELANLCEVVDIDELSIDEMQDILRANKVKGWNLIKKESTLREKVAAL